LADTLGFIEIALGPTRSFKSCLEATCNDGHQGIDSLAPRREERAAGARRDLLGYASITTTERYDNQKLENLQAAAARLQRGETGC
jgi:hypothetical protein